jgi:hypothetical protein
MACGALSLPWARQMTVRLTALCGARNGDWVVSRRAILADVGEPYRAAHGLSREERSRRSLRRSPANAQKQDHHLSPQQFSESRQG